MFKIVKNKYTRKSNYNKTICFLSTYPSTLENIGTYAFAYCDALKKITIPNSIKGIGQNAFYYSGTEEVVLQDGITTIYDHAFAYLTKLKKINIPNSVTTIESKAFIMCTELTVTIPNTVTTIEVYAFMSVPSIYYDGTAEGSPWGADSLNGN